MTQWDEETGLLVFGAGAGGMTAALAGKLAGLDVLLCEKTATVGGITSSSAGTAWIPGTSQSRRAGVPDTVERARAYLGFGDRRARRRCRARELSSSPARRSLTTLETRSEVKFAAATAHPDYLANHPGRGFRRSRLGAALPFDGRLLGADFARVRPPAAEFMVLGGMMVSQRDIPALLAPFRSRGQSSPSRAACSPGTRWTGCASLAAPAWSWATPSLPVCSTACAGHRCRSASRRGSPSCSVTGAGSSVPWWRGQMAAVRSGRSGASCWLLVDWRATRHCGRRCSPSRREPCPWRPGATPAMRSGRRSPKARRWTTTWRAPGCGCRARCSCGRTARNPSGRISCWTVPSRG